MTGRILISPNKYVQGNHALNKLGEQVKKLGQKALVLSDKTALPLIKSKVEQSLTASNVEVQFEIFQGECSMDEINRIIKLSDSINAEMIIGIGGGKTIDTAKAAAHFRQGPVAVVPTIASTDAPCSALSVIYTPEGIFEKYLFLPKNPDLVLVDTNIVAKAPVRLLVSGMGDALATWFEASACYEEAAKNLPGGLSTQAALTLAELCYNLLIEYGLRAKLAVEKGVVTEDVEKIVEANTLLSGIGFESGGLAAAHSIHNGLTALDETHQFFHGEKVAFGTLVQLILENRSNEELTEVLDFCVSVGLPVTLKQIGVTDTTEEKIRKVADLSCAEGETIYNMPVAITPEIVYNAIIAADAVGQHYLD